MKRKGYNSSKRIQKLKTKIMKRLKKSTSIFFLAFIAGVTLYFIIKLALFSFSIAWEKVSSSGSFSLDEIYVSGNRVLKPEEVIVLTEIEPGMSLLSINCEAIEERLLSQKRIERAIITREFPSKLKIIVIEREPVALINIDKIYEVDQTGVLMEIKHRSLDLPMITGFETDSLGYEKFRHQIENNLRDVVGFISNFRMADNAMMNYVSEFRLDKDNNITLVLNNGITQIYMGSGEFYDKSIKLSALLKEKSSNIVKYDYIDLRFKNLAFAK